MMKSSCRFPHYLPQETCFQLVENAPNDTSRSLFETYPRYSTNKMGPKFKFYRFFVQYLVHKKSVYLGLVTQR